jgi:allantoicase
VQWQTILSNKKLSADFIHEFKSELSDKSFTHVRLNIFPDGGISRLRLLGIKKG